MGGGDNTVIQSRIRGYFNSKLFNTVVGEYLESFLDEFVKQYMLVSAKGSSGQMFQTAGSRFDKVVNQYDMPYHIHIINGLLPALKLLEERFKKEGWLEQKEAPLFLRCFIAGFTFHDVNKLTGINELNESVEQSLIPLCKILKLERFFPEWRDWIEEIKFLALGTEYRTKIYAHQKTIKEYDFFNTVLSEHCHLADSISSMENFSSVAEFYEQLSKKQLDGKQIADLWQLSFVEVQENIFTLLSQKLLFAAKTLIQDTREQTILFSLRNGFVYIGQPLSTDEIDKIKMDFKSDLSDVVKSSLLDFQECKFGFLKSLSEESDSENKYHAQIKNALEKILKAGFANSGAGSEKIRPFVITNYAPLLKEKNTKPQEIENLEKLFEVLDAQGFKPAEIIESISDKATPSSRKIHGQIKVTFLKGATPLQYLISNAETVKQWLKDGERVLVVFDRMTELRMARPEIENQFHDVVIAEVSGYYTKSEFKEEPGNAGLILGTNKIEVGVNLDVSICLMQTGKHFANFIQRFGRIARQGKDGKAIIFLDNKIKEIEKAFTGKETMLYYDFIEQCRNIELLSDRKFYSEKIPQYLGAYYFIIAKNIKDYATQRLFRENINLDGQAGFMLGLMRKIDKGVRSFEYINSACGRKFDFDSENWKRWWEIFTDTFKYFRTSMPDVLVRDLTCPNDKQITRYSLEWILQNREITGEEHINGERCLVVSGFSEGKQELQYYVESLPVYKLSEGTLYLQQKEKYSLKEAFEKRLAEVATTYRGQNLFAKTAQEVINAVARLKPIITQKRLLVSDVRSYSNFL